MFETIINIGRNRVYARKREDGVYELGNNTYNKDKSEFRYRDALKDILDNAETEVTIGVGRADVVTEDAVIEVKDADKFLDAIGQVLYYQFELPGRKKPFIAYFGEVKTEYIPLCDRLGITILDVSRLYRKSKNQEYTKEESQPLIFRIFQKLFN